jgi:hypothetical protein
VYCDLFADLKMKRKSSATTNLRAFLVRAAAKNKDIVASSSNEREMQLVIFQGQTETSNATPTEQERVEHEPPIIEDAKDNDDFKSVHLNGTTSSEDNDSDDTDIFMSLSMILD